MGFNSRAYDSTGQAILCDDCDNIAGFHLIGENEQISKCIDHNPFGSITEPSFIYKPPKEISDGPRKITTDYWIVNLRGEDK